jgi:hypothetical protein
MAQNIGKDWKDPDDTKKFTVNWAPYLRSGATISSSSCPSVPSGISVSSTTNDTATVTHTVTGGQKGKSYVLTSRVVTSDSEQLDLEFTIQVL